MDWYHILGIIVGNAAIFIPMFFWLRTEANSDRRQMQDTAAADRRDLLQIIREIQAEMKDFHSRLERIDIEFKGYLIQEAKKR